MKQWHSLNLGDGMMANIPADEIKKAFLKIFTKSGNLPEMAIFTRHESGDLHCEVIAYFSPAAQYLAKAFDAQPCEKPVRAELGLLAGNENSWAVLFPESD